MGTLVPFVIGKVIPCKAPGCSGEMVLVKVVGPPKRGRWECSTCTSWVSLTEDGKVYAHAWLAA